MKKETSSGGIVFRQSQNEWQVLLVKHASTLYWGFPKGLVGDFDKDESLETAALREVEEEGGVKAKIIASLPQPSRYQTSWRGETINKTVYYFVMKFVSGDPQNHDQEISEAGWFSIPKALRALTYANDQHFLKQAVLLLGIEPRTPKL